MSVTTNIEDPQTFDRATVGLLAGGLAAGGATAALATAFNASTAGLGALAFGVVVGLVTYLVDDTEDDALVGLLMCIGGGVALAAGLGVGLASVGWAATAVAGGLIGLGAGARHFDSRRRLLWTALSAVALVAARFTTLELLSPERFAALDSIALQQVLSSGIWGLFMAGAVGTGFVQLDRDEVVARIEKAKKDSIAPVRDYLGSAMDIYAKVLSEIGRGSTSKIDERARAIAEETIDSLVECSLRYTELREGISTQKARTLRQRAETLDARIEGARNPELAAQLRRTQDEVLEQLDMQEELELACARLEARGQRCVTMLERLHVTLVQNGSGEIENAALNESFEELEHLTDEVQMKSLSVDELLATIDESAESSVDDACEHPSEERVSISGEYDHGSDDAPDGFDGTLDDGTDGATLGATDSERQEPSTTDEVVQEEEHNHVVRAEHQSC